MEQEVLVFKYVCLITLNDILCQCKGVTFLTSKDNIGIILTIQNMFVDQTVREKQIKITVIHQKSTKPKVTSIDHDHPHPQKGKK